MQVSLRKWVGRWVGRCQLFLLLVKLLILTFLTSVTVKDIDLSVHSM